MGFKDRGTNTVDDDASSCRKRGGLNEDRILPFLISLGRIIAFQNKLGWGIAASSMPEGRAYSWKKFEKLSTAAAVIDKTGKTK